MPRFQTMNPRYTVAIARRKLAQRRRRLGRPRLYGSGRTRYNVYHFKRSVYYQNVISVDNLTNYVTAWGFTLAQLPGYSNFTELYDEYRINKVVMKIIPKFNEVVIPTDSSSGEVKVLSQVHTAIDYDDSLSLPQASALDDICQYQNHKMTMGNRMHTRVLVPRVELAADSSYSAPKARQWLDCDNATALHNGIKVCIPKLQSANTSLEINYDVQITTYLSFRNVK